MSNCFTKIQTIKVVRGDTPTLIVTIRDQDDELVDLAGTTVFFTVKSNLKDSDDAALIAKNITSHVDAPNGVTAISLTSDDTDLEPYDQYFWDIQVKFSDDSILSASFGEFAIIEDVTKRIS